MEGDQQHILDLVKEVNFLSDTISKFGWMIIILGWVFAALIWYGIRAYEGKTHSRTEFFVFKAKKLYKSGNMEALLKYCDKYLKTYPNDLDIHWFYALGNFQKDRWDIAKLHFEKVIALNPGWRENVEPYLNEIEDSAFNDDVSH